jgi:hypothetical protein
VGWSLASEGDDETALKVDNNWPADLFAQWVGIVEASLKASEQSCSRPRGDKRATLPNLRHFETFCLVLQSNHLSLSGITML